MMHQIELQMPRFGDVAGNTIGGERLLVGVERRGGLARAGFWRPGGQVARQMFPTRTKFGCSRNAQG